MGIATQTITRFSMSKGTENSWPDTNLPMMNILICYEGIFPQYSRRDGALIVLITNDSWFGNSGGPMQHLIFARFRAMENGRPLVRSARTGISAIIDARGNIIKEVPLNTAGVVTAKIGPRYSDTIYRKFGDWPLLIVLLVGAIALMRRIYIDRAARNQ